MLPTTPPPPPPPEQQKFKVICGEYSATITLNAQWLARPFLTAVVKPLVLKLNKRADKEPVKAECLERVEVDGEEVALPDAATSAAALVGPAASRVELFFGLAPPLELKFVVHCQSIDCTITLDAKFMRKSFVDAVVKPFTTLYNKRTNRAPVAAEDLVEVLIDGAKPSVSPGSLTRTTAFDFLGRNPSHVELFFS